MYNFSLIIWWEITWISQYLKEPTDSLLSFILSLSLDIYIKVILVKGANNLIQDFEKFQWCLVIELNKTQVEHEWRSIQAIYNLFDFRSR